MDATSTIWHCKMKFANLSLTEPIVRIIKNAYLEGSKKKFLEKLEKLLYAGGELDKQAQACA